jgi:hypothetical protein
MPEPKSLLEAARVRLRSKVPPHAPMKRPELTELVNQYMLRHHPDEGREQLLGAGDLARMERAGVWWPSWVRREAFRAVLGVDNDADLGFMSAPERRAREIATFGSAAAESAGHDDARPAGPRNAPASADSLPVNVLPAVVGPEDISELRDDADQFRLWDARSGGSGVRQAALDRVHFAVRILNQVPCPDRYRRDLYSAVGRLAQAAAFMAFDGKKYADATKLFVFGKDCAEEADDWGLRASIYSSMARQAFWQDKPDAGRTCIEYARVRIDRLTPTEQAMVSAVHARALAKLGQVREAVMAVRGADDAFAAATADVGYAAYYDEAEHHGETGHALSDLAMHGYYRAEAARRLTTAIGLHGQDYVRSRTFCEIQLAMQQMNCGDPYEAAALGFQAVEDAVSIRSTRVNDTLLELYKVAGRRVRHRAAAELRERIGTLVSV